MAAFKDDVLDDLSVVFFNGDEFADVHEFNGYEVLCVAEGLTTNQAITKQTKHAAVFEGISNETISVHIKTEDLLEKVESENVCTFDGVTYRISNVTEDMGVTSIILEVDTM